MTEYKLLHKPTIEWLREKNIFYIRKNDAKNHYRQTSDGVPDFVILLPKSRIVFVEYKTKEKIKQKNKGLSKRQEEWRKYLIDNEYWYILTSNWEEVKEKIEKILEE
jgi:hypothetical protein